MPVELEVRSKRWPRGGGASGGAVAGSCTGWWEERPGMGMEVAASAARCGEMRGREKVRERCPLGDLALDLLVFIGVGFWGEREVF